ncbi:MAG: hypothetical protein Q8P81_00760, partial [Nanoarchaeota archaeon]|nr:hypothetical protein [Nanoarchaeota archaeon]
RRQPSLDRQIEETWEAYNPETDIEATGGEVGIRLAGLIRKKQLLEESVRDTKGLAGQRESDRYYQALLLETRSEHLTPERRSHLLGKYFPESFGPDGIHPAQEMGEEQLSRTFKGIIHYAKGRLEQK